ncbi:MAG: hypothetical protein N4A72_18925 [Bacteroidales bacterium]|nr:hypothetical protein [Bacteroidales bacterium]
MESFKQLMLLCAITLSLACIGCKKEDSEKEKAKKFNTDLVGTWEYKGSKVVTYFGQVNVNKTLKFTDKGDYTYKSEEYNASKSYNNKHNEEGEAKISSPTDKEVAEYKKSFGDEINPTIKVILDNGKNKSTGYIQLSSDKNGLTYFWETSGGEKKKRVYKKI